MTTTPTSRPWHEVASPPPQVDASTRFAAQALAHLRAHTAATDPATAAHHHDVFLAAFTAAASVRCGWSWTATAAVAAGHARAAAALTEWLRGDGIDPEGIAPAETPATTLDRIASLVERSAANGDLIPASAVRMAIASPAGGEPPFTRGVQLEPGPGLIEDMQALDRLATGGEPR